MWKRLGGGRGDSCMAANLRYAPQLKGEGCRQLGSLLSCLFSVVSSQDLCSPGWHRIHYVDQAGLELTEIHLPPPPECRD